MAEQKIITARIITLGCRLNTADSALLYSALNECGCVPIEEGTPDIVILNTCAVTAEAERKSRHALRKLRRDFPHARLIAAGCAVDADAEALISAGADLVCTNLQKRNLPQILRGETSGNTEKISQDPVFREKRLSSFPFRSRAFIKIQEGCDNHCSYCLVPTLRGPACSRDFNEVLDDCRHALDNGFAELVLTGVNSCAYLDHNRRLPELLEAISALPGEFRIRLGSTEPGLRNRKIIDAVANLPKICRFLHLSLQHGSDTVLQRMNRRYSSGEYADFVLEAKELIPGLHLGTDVIVGFPGETDAEFSESCEFISKIGFSNIHIFAYSPRPGTPAAVMSNRPTGDVVQQRCAMLRKIAATSATAFIQSQIGKPLPVIFERITNGVARGWSDNYLEVVMPKEEIITGKIIAVTATCDNLSTNQDSE